MTRCGFCSENGHRMNTCNNDRIGLLLLRMRCKTEKSDRTGNLFVLFNWLETYGANILKMMLCKKYGFSTSNYKKDMLIAMIMEMEFPDVEADQAFWRAEFMNTTVQPRLPLENFQEKELLVHNVCEISNWSEEQLIGFSNSTLFDIFMACLKKNEEGAKFNIQIVVDVECVNVEKDCSICLEKVDSQDILKYNCSHEFCCECSLQHIKSKKTHPNCALCRTPINSITTSSENCEKIGEIIV